MADSFDAALEGDSLSSPCSDLRARVTELAAPYGHISKADERQLDSPVGVAATACEHKRQRCENDHAVCRDCGAVNRAVTGIVDWGPAAPPETARQDGSTGVVACLCGEWCREESATCRRRKGHDGPHTSALNEARRLDETLTRADLSALEERIVERVCEALEHVAETVSPAHWSAGMTRLADELRRKP